MCRSDDLPSHWAVENSFHPCVDVVFTEDQMRARTSDAAVTSASSATSP
jgi:predicted transposase YbfD/YdcC